MLMERGIFERVARRWVEFQPASSQKFKYWEMILKFRIDRHQETHTGAHDTGVRRGIKRVPICKGVVEVEGVDVAILLTKQEHGIFPSF